MTPEQIAGQLTDAQRKWVLSMPDGEREVTEAEWFWSPDYFVQTVPADPEDGFGGDRVWFGAGGMHFNNGKSVCTEWLNPLGLAVRALLEKQDG